MQEITRKPFNIVKKAQPKESEIQKAIIEYLKLKKIFHYRQNQAALKTPTTFFRATSINGLPDIIAIIDGIYTGLEVKTEKGKLSPAQIQAHEKIQAAGGLVFVVRSVDDVRRIFER